MTAEDRSLAGARTGAMPYIAYEARNFAAALAVPTAGRMPLPKPELVWGAKTVGALPISMGGVQRPILEAGWRAAMVAANLDTDQKSGSWVKTAAYRRLDGSEKSAVSYFLGMTQAKVTCARLLRAPHLIHLDTYLAMIGQSTSQSRPDLVGVTPALDCTIVVEAKGLSGPWRREVAKKAKKQAASLPGVRGTDSALRIASVAYFDRQDRWEAYLEDPPATVQPHASLTVEAVLTTYYRPLVAALLETSESGRAAVVQVDAMTTAYLPGIDVTLGVPTPIMTVMRSLPPTGTLTAKQVEATGSALRQIVQDRPFPRQGPTGQEDDHGAVRYQSYYGLDGVYVELGSTWR